jgi:DNA repair photolyase
MAHVEYRELICKSVLNRVPPGRPYQWTLNPYRGCAHGCHYCYARGTHTYLGLGAGRDFSTVVFAKTNAPEVLYRELRRPGWQRERISIGSATDPYQPAEGRFRITRRLLEVLADYSNPTSIVTKGTLIVRDADVLADIERRASCTVCFSVATVDRAIWRATEPGTASPDQRLRAMERLAGAGILVGVLATPILPGLSDTPQQLEELVRAATAHGAGFLAPGTLHLGPLERDHYLGFLGHTYPALLPLYRRLYGGKYPPRQAAVRLEETVAELKARYGLVDRTHAANRPRQAVLPFAEADVN